MPTLPRPPEPVKRALRWLGGALGRLLRRFGPVVALLLAAVALVVAEFLTFREIKAVTVVPPGGTTTGGSHHGYALAVLGITAMPMAVGAALGGSRPAAAALAGLGAVALAIVAAIDLPSLDDTGLIGRTYDLAEAHPAAGFWIQLVAAAVLLVGGLLLLRRNNVAAARDAESRDRERAARREEEEATRP
jgi:hypothetical protein